MHLCRINVSEYPGMHDSLQMTAEWAIGQQPKVTRNSPGDGCVPVGLYARATRVRYTMKLTCCLFGFSQQNHRIS